MKNLTFKIFCLLIILLIIPKVYSQNVGINTNGNKPNADAALDIDFSDKGVLIPRVALAGTANSSPLSAHVAGMMVYNTATTGDVLPGFYYNDGTHWITGFPAGNVIGDMLYWNGSAWSLLPAGTAGQYLQVNASNIPFWASPAAPSGPVLTTTAASAITGSAAVSGGTITADGGSAIVSRGVCWKLTSGPTIADSKTTDGSGIGNYSSSLASLLPATMYYVRAYAMNSNVITYGNEITFTTSPVLPTLAATTAATSITGTSAVSGGNITNSGGANILERGICYATTANPTTANTKVIDPGTSTGTFTGSLTGLRGATLYYVRSYATNSVGTAYGTQISFTTAVVPPTLVTVAASSISGASAVSGASMSWNGGGYSNYQNYGVAYSTTPVSVLPPYIEVSSYTRIATNTANGSVNPAININPWITNLVGLSANTTYYIRAYLNLYLSSPAGWVTIYGNELSFTTTAPSAPIIGTTTAITGISDRTGNTGGTIISDGGSAITAKGVCWSTSPNPTLGAGNFTSNGTGSATFTSNITGLTGNTTYYVRAYATNGIGTSYGPVDVSFTTWVTAPYTLGQNLGYGYCAYVDATGHGFIVSVDIPSTAPWGCSGTTIATSTALGSGQANTTLILSSCATRPIAASVAASYNGGGFNDWYLPSSGEMAKIAALGSQVGIGTSLNNYYTSSQSSTTYAATWFTNFSSGYASSASKLAGGSDYINQLRAIRNF